MILRKDTGVNEANLRFYASDSNTDPPGTPFEIKLPDGYDTWAIAWKRDSTILWVAEKGGMRSVDFTNPADVKETRIDPDDTSKVPERSRDALRPTFERSKPNGPPAAATS